MAEQVIIAKRLPSGILTGSRTVQRKIRDVPPRVHDDKGHDHWPGYEKCILVDGRLIPVRPNGTGWWWGESREALRHDSWMYQL